MAIDDDIRVSIVGHGRGRDDGYVVDGSSLAWVKRFRADDEDRGRLVVIIAVAVMLSRLGRGDGKNLVANCDAGTLWLLCLIIGIVIGLVARRMLTWLFGLRIIVDIPLSV